MERVEGVSKGAERVEGVSKGVERVEGVSKEVERVEGASKGVERVSERVLGPSTAEPSTREAKGRHCQRGVGTSHLPTQLRETNTNVVLELVE